MTQVPAQDGGRTVTQVCECEGGPSTLRSCLAGLEAVAFWLLVGGLVLYATAHLCADDRSVLFAALHALAGYAWGPALALLAWAGVRGRGRRIGALVLAVTLSWVIPGHLSGTPSGQVALRLGTSNVLMVHPDPDALITELVAEDPDVLLLQEINPRWAERLRASEALRPWPHRIFEPQEGSFGVAVLSKPPIQVAIEALGGVPMARVELWLEGRPLWLYGIHTLPPRDAALTTRWHEQMAQLTRVVQRRSAPVVLAGDLNATRHHPSLRRLLAAGLMDAHAEVGRASASTWPNGIFPVPPLRLDHVLISDELEVHRVWEGAGWGSDHRPVFAELGWRRP